jgi:hypothetical protein
LKKKILLTLIFILALISVDFTEFLFRKGVGNLISYNPLNLSFQFFTNRYLCAEVLPAKEKSENQNTKQAQDKAYKNYIELKKLYIKWNKGLLKSRRYYKRFITKYLIDIIGKEILTDYDYFVISPEGAEGKELTCNLYLGRWLQIKGDIKQETLIKIVEKNPSLLTKWWRSQKLLAVQGRLKDFKLDEDAFGEVVILHLKDIKVKEVGGDIAGKNSK